MSTIFTKIIRGDVHAHKIYEDEEVFAFLDIDQSKAGHILVVPKLEVDKFYDVPDELYVKLFLVAKKLAIALEKASSCRVQMGLTGVDVPHTHIHLTPIEKIHGNIYGVNALDGLSDTEIAAKIRSYL
ncbi:MAG: HIT family protein [Candidatus Nomurabacteria bacterium]|jgi:histidine triad (HIT) family protein|nr:HIT family protein [Candidatus Nomurabacteria bacterium]